MPTRGAGGPLLEVLDGDLAVLVGAHRREGLGLHVACHEEAERRAQDARRGLDLDLIQVARVVLVDLREDLLDGQLAVAVVVGLEGLAHRRDGDAALHDHDARGLELLLQRKLVHVLDAQRRPPVREYIEAHLGFGRIVASETERPKLFVDML
jgi:hypothetical protein